MNPRDLLNLDPGALEKMTEMELEAIFKPFFHVTRPAESRQEQSSGPIKPKMKPTKKLGSIGSSKRLDAILARADKLGA